MNHKKWQLISTQNIHENPWLSLEKRSYKLPHGAVKDDYYHLNRPDYVVVVALDEQKRLLVERQYRRGVDDFVYELPTGWIEPGESPIAAAKRELQEETGAHGEGDTVFEFYPQPGFSSMRAYVCILKVHAIGEARLAEDEFITIEWMSMERIRQMIQKAEMKDMGFLAALSLIDKS